MLVTTLATSTIYGYWGFHIVERLLDEVYGGAHRIHCLDLQQLHSQWDARGERPVLVTTDRPDPALSLMLANSGFPVLAFFDSGYAAMAHCMVVDGRTAASAVRFCSQYFSTLAPCLAQPGVHVFGPERFGSRLSELVADVAAALALELDEAALARVVQASAEAELYGADPTVETVMRVKMGGESLLEAAARAISPADRELLERAAASYEPVLFGRGAQAIDWPRELFYADVKEGAVDSDVQLIGGARHIYWGPYLHLPVGRWRAAIQFEVTNNISGNEIEGDVCAAMTQLAKAAARLPERGYFRFDLEFSIKDPNAPIEVRIQLMKGAIEGRFGLRRVTVEPVIAVEGALAAPEASLAPPPGDANAAHV